MPNEPTLGELARAIDRAAPESLAESWDNVGLQVGDPAMPVRGVMTVLECDSSTVEEARAAGANVIVAHHPLIFRPLKGIRTDNYQGKAIGEILAAGMGFICAHTNLDKAPFGTNKVMAELVGMRIVEYLHPEPADALRKYVVFVPEGHERAVIDAIDRAGGGRIGHYRKCSFRVAGTGTFQGDETTNPAIGEAGKFEQASEFRLEAVVPCSRVRAVAEAVRKAHPYEEVAHEFYELDARGDADWGLGYVGELDLARPQWGDAAPSLRQFAQKLGELFKTDYLLAIGEPERKIHRVAVSSGSGGHSIAGSSGDDFDVLVTGEINYHQGCEARHKGMAVVCVGHFASETFASDALAARLRELFPGLPVRASESAADPFWHP